MLVRIIKDWSAPDLMRQTPNHSGEWDGIQFTFDPVTECDYLVSLNPPRVKVTGKCPPNHKWLLTQEPPVDHYEWHKNGFAPFDKVFTQHENDGRAKHLIHEHGALPWHIGRSFDELVTLQPGNKIDQISTVTSNAYSRPGHKARYDLIQYLREEQFDLALFGKGIRWIDDKFDGIYPYKYSIAIENSFYPHYWTEKLSDCLLSWTMPVYAGCPNITDYFPEEALIIIDPFNLEEAKAIMEEAVATDRWHKNLDAIAEARNLILHKYQFFPWIANKIKAESNTTSFEKEHFKIPKTKNPHQKPFPQRIVSKSIDFIKNKFR